MRAISFKLSAKTACFRKPDVNQYAYFTYNNIHKPALFGLLGAVIGLGGHTQLHNENRGKKSNQLEFNHGYPEFYEKLQHLKVSITPLALNGYFSKKIQVFNNSVGYASFEMGGNLIVREQWLENPAWQIMILDDESDAYTKLAEYLLNGKSVFIPYLGKNDHFANIDEVAILDLSQPKSNYIDSLFIKDFDKLDDFAKENETPYIFQEISPMRLQKEHHFYEYEALIFTNYELKNLPNDVFEHAGKNYAFI
jgi:CRISPR-associated protein Cas5h